MNKDFHEKPFDEGTKIKLLLYEKYLQEWLPVFLAKKEPIWHTNINIFDFFAGPGQDSQQVKGSPLLAIDCVNKYSSHIIDKNIALNLYLNEINKDKLENLKNNISKLMITPNLIKIHFSDLDFHKAFDTYYSKMKLSNTANFLFLDQCGIKAIEPHIFKKMIGLNTTDFLFFTASSYVYRFAEVEPMKQHIPISKNVLSSSGYLKIHREVVQHYKSLLPKDYTYYLAPFSIKKGTNIYGLTFGSHHVLGMEKFLRTCWDIDCERGEANFDIDGDDINQAEPSLFEELNKPTKLHIFEKLLEKNILEKNLKTNKDIFLFTIESGCLPKHAKALIECLINENKIPKQKLNVSYDAFSKPETQLIRLY